jgi:putative ABC transport system permease protein
VAISLPALAATAALLAVGAFAFTPRSAVPTAGILIGGAMAATTLTGRRLLESLRDEVPEIETRLALGDSARTALAPAIRRAVHTGLIPVIDQTRSVGLVTLPGTFVGLVLGGASAEEAAATQLVVLLALLAVELGSGLLLAELTQRAVILPGERVARVPPAR